MDVDEDLIEFLDNEAEFEDKDELEDINKP